MPNLACQPRRKTFISGFVICLGELEGCKNHISRRMPFRVTHNLFEAINGVREAQSVMIWIDAICINQQDGEEKCIQVKMMRNIYKQATSVIFWLGQQGDYDNAAFRLMNVFVQKHKVFSNLEPFRGKSLSQIGLRVMPDGSVGARPWFGRVWIVQEFLNASQSVFMTGDLRIPSDLLIWFAFATGACSAIGQVVAFHNVNIRNNRDLVLRPFALSLDTKLRASGGVDDTRIVDLWTRSQLLGATDPRDRVFALLSTQTTVSMDLVDYSKGIPAVYTEIAELALKIPVSWSYWSKIDWWALDNIPMSKNKERTSRFLACKTMSTHLPRLPSWVPDWRPARYRFVPLTRYFPGTAWFTRSYSHAVVKGKALFISGCIVDRPNIIVESTPYMLMDCPPRAQGYAYHTSMQSWLKKVLDWQILCYLLARSYGKVSKKNKLLEDFSRTMAFSALPERGITSGAKYIAGFQALHSNIATGLMGTVKYRLMLPDLGPPTDQDVVYESVAHELAAGRRFAITNSGDYAWIPSSTKLGDCICFLAGCAVPFVMRPTGRSFELLGDCYLHSMMRDGSITISAEPRTFKFQ